MASSETIFNTFLRFNAPLVVSCARNCYPDPTLSDKHPVSRSSFRYLNSGVYIGYVRTLKQFFSDISPINPADNDQDVMMHYFLEHQNHFTLDSGCEISLSLNSVTEEELFFDRKNSCIRLLETNTTPCLIHGNGHTIWYQYIYNNFFLKDPVEQITQIKEDKKVLLAILAKDNAPVLPKYLHCIEQLDYGPKHVVVYIHVQKSQDNTLEILTTWQSEQKLRYQKIHFEYDDTEAYDQSLVSMRFKIATDTRNRSLQIAKDLECDFYFSVDTDNFIAPCTLKELIRKNKPVIAPLLRNIPEPDMHTPQDFSSNFYYDITEQGSFKEHESYLKILNAEMTGTFKVSLVLGTYLIRKDALSTLTFSDQTTDPAYLVFSKTARAKDIDQYICNEKNFGAMLHFIDYPSKEQISVLKAYLAS